MSLTNVSFTRWRRFLAVFSSDDRPKLIENLCTAYRAEAGAVAQCAQHAQRMYYPHFRAALLRIAAEIQAHIPWLREKILALGGDLPQFSSTPTMGSNSWECLRLDLEEAQRSRSNLLEWIHLAEHVEPEIAVGLRHIREEKLKHREELRDMLMKSDPYTIPNTAIPHEQVEKQAWLGQRKSEWLDHERAEWKAGGKQVPWAEWSGEQEFKWATELPYRDLEWARCLAKQGGSADRQPGRGRGTGGGGSAPLYVGEEKPPLHC